MFSVIKTIVNVVFVTRIGCSFENPGNASVPSAGQNGTGNLTLTAMEALFKNLSGDMINRAVKDAFKESQMEYLGRHDIRCTSSNINADIPPVTIQSDDTKLKSFFSVMTKKMKCGNCVTCARDEICLLYFFAFILPLIANDNSSSVANKASSDNIFKTMLSINNQTIDRESQVASQNLKRSLTEKRLISSENYIFIDIYFMLFNIKDFGGGFHNVCPSSSDPFETHNISCPLEVSSRLCSPPLRQLPGICPLDESSKLPPSYGKNYGKIPDLGIDTVEGAEYGKNYGRKF